MADIIVNGFNVGTELQQIILTSDLGSFPSSQLGHLKSFKADQEASKITCTPVAYNGRRFHRNIYHDWAGTLTFTRFDATLTALVAQIMNRFQLTGAETYFSIFTQINNTAAGTRDNYLFEEVVLDQHNLGEFNGTGEVENSIAFRCQSMTIS